MREDIHLFAPTYDVEGCLANIKEVLESGWTAPGAWTHRFEEAWKEFAGVPNAHFMSSCSEGLLTALQVLKEDRGWRDDDEIITTPLTFVATNQAILRAGLKPVFADVEDHLCLGWEEVCKQVSPRTRAVMYVGLGGQAPSLDQVSQYCRAEGLDLIVDAAHLAGLKSLTQHCTAYVFSFQSVKPLSTGDGGMLCFTSDELHQKAKQASWHGINQDTFERCNISEEGYRWAYTVEGYGWKSRGNSIAAAVGLAELPKLQEKVEARKRNRQLMIEALSESFLLSVVKHAESTYHLFQILVPPEDRNNMMKHLNNVGIFPGVHYLTNQNYKPFRGGRRAHFASLASERLISLPCHENLTTDQIGRVATTVSKFYC